MNRKIRAFDGFWAVYLNGYIFLLRSEDLDRAVSGVINRYGAEQWLQFKLSLSVFARLFDAKLHAAIERDAVNALQRYYQESPRNIPTYAFAGDEAREVALTFIEACTMCTASKGLFTLEQIEIQDREQWILREYYKPTLMERLGGKKRLAKTVVITPSEIKSLSGNSMNFQLEVGKETYRICEEGIRQ